MAYMNQEKKAKIAAALKLVMPAGWKYSLAVRHHSTIVCTIKAAPFDVLATVNGSAQADGYWDVNQYHVESHCSDACLVDVLRAIMGALNTDNHDRSDTMTDYFDVGHYVDLSFGAWNKPFVNTTQQLKVAA